MGMENFSPEFESPEHYIIDITYRIWEERGVGLINEWYAADAPVRDPHGVTNTVESVILHTLEAMAEFPDQEALAEDVIIGDKERGFYSSHRVRNQATHLADGYYGAATNRFVSSLVIADCLCRDNRVVGEWLVGDHAGIVQQLGMEPEVFGRELGKKRPAAYVIGNGAMRKRWSDRQGLTVVGDGTIANRVIDTLDAIWNDKNLTVMDKQYDRALRFEGPTNYVGFGRAQAGNWFYSLLAAMPDGRFEPHHVIVRQQEARPVRVAVRWSFCGSHSGHGRYGRASGLPLGILAISHFELRDGLIANEWLVFDETAVYAQLGAYQSI